MRELKLIVALLALTFFIACGVEEPTSDLPVPEEFSVDIPNSLSNRDAAGISGRADATQEAIAGEDIYEALRYYIYLGEQSSEIMEVTLGIAAILNESNLRSFPFTSDEDNRQKRVELERDVTRGGVDYEFEMIVVDAENEELAVQLLWNSDPVEGVAIMNPYNINRLEERATPDAYYRIDYTEDHPDYEQAMTVSISGATIEENGDPDNLKMFAGRNGDIVEVIGNSNHPEMEIIDPNFEGGRNYAFVGRADEANGIGVVNLWLPESDVTTNDFEPGDEYSVYDVLEDEINAVANLDQSTIDAILAEAYSPAYFRDEGFEGSGEDNQPTDFSDAFVDLSGMSPFVPNAVQTLSIDFIQ